MDKAILQVQSPWFPLYFTLSALHEYYDKISHDINEEQIPTGLFCDLSLAFDCVRNELFDKWYSCQICGIAYNRFQSYLKDRPQLVKLQSKLSDIMPDIDFSEQLQSETQNNITFPTKSISK